MKVFKSITKIILKVALFFMAGAAVSYFFLREASTTATLIVGGAAIGLVLYGFYAFCMALAHADENCESFDEDKKDR